MKRKLLSLILVAAMLASMLVFAPASGAATNTTANVAVTDATVKAGGTVSVDVIVTTEKVQIFDLLFNYDASKLEIVKWDNDTSEINAQVLGAFASGSGNTKAAAPKGLVGFGSSITRPQDASTGLAIATITFNVKADAAPGDTYISFAAVDGAYIMATSESQKIQGENLTTKAGKITILPAGYEEATQWVVLDDIPEATFDEDEELDLYGYVVDGDTCTLVGYAYLDCGVQTGYVEIPAYIDGYKVVAIDEDAFRGSDYTMIKIPDTVTSIGKNAFNGAEKCVAVYVLNDSCTIAARTAFNTKNKEYGGTVVYTNSSNIAETMAANPYDFVTVQAYAPAPTLTYTVGSDTYTYVVGNSTVAPGSAVVDGEVIVAWNDGTNNIAPGASMTIAGATTLTPVTITAPATQNGADVKVGATANDFALRFTSKLAIEDYKTLADLGGGKVTLGMLITPQKYVDYAVSFTKADLAAWAVSQGAQAENAYVDVAINGYYQKDTTDYTLAASLQGFSNATTTKNPTFAAIAYAEITIGGNVVTVYGSYDEACGRDAKTVLTALSNAGTLGATQQGWLATLLDKFD